MRLSFPNNCKEAECPSGMFCAEDDATRCTALQTQDDIVFPRLYCGKLERKHQSTFLPRHGEEDRKIRAQIVSILLLVDPSKT